MVQVHTAGAAGLLLVGHHHRRRLGPQLVLRMRCAFEDLAARWPPPGLSSHRYGASDDHEG
ncbi:unnamed protein product [Effrenium voratum]|uniref:Uncharacterized protein n=1 Tax=Effrenium voratum TaxID=2562239 RepID=A0AA36I4Z1_9DINO|nr:unnamed protein product [Effrenium voratum]CAJ1380303.1 unnamed protein product [Effrenium voratum]